jgi:iron complex outermembrane receptor protein
VPGLTVSNNPNNISINIRGIGLTFNSPNIAQGVPIYRDGLLVPTSIGDEPLWDVANVQVLRGPQGTLVGANSTGGALFINTVNPDVTDGVRGYQQVTVGDYRHVQAQSAVNLPIGPALAARVGAYIERRDSYSADLTPAASSANRPEPGDLDMTALRGSLLWKPTARVQLLGKLEYFENRTGYVAEKPIGIASTRIDGVMTVCPAPGSYLGADPATWNQVPAACGFAPFAPANDYQIAYGSGSSLLREQVWRDSVEGRFVLTDAGMTLRILAGASYNTTHVQNDNTASINYNGGSSSATHEHSLTWEADLLSPVDGALQWVVGGFFWRDPTAFIFTQLNYSGGPYGFGPGYSQPTGGLYLNGDNSRESYAAFANVNYRLNPRWKLELGARETRDRNGNPFHACSAPANTPSCIDGDSNAFHFLSPDPANPWGPMLYNGDGFANLGYEQDSLFTWKAALDYDLAPQSYLYALVATGAKAGGVRTNTPGDNFTPERDADLELGWKATALAGSVSIQLNGFYTHYNDMQIRAIDTASGQDSIFNAGTANVFGVEFAGTAELGAWQLAATGSYTKSAFSIGHIVNQDICNLYQPCAAGRPVQCPPGVANGPYNGGQCFDFESGGLYVNGRFYPWLENVTGLQLPNSPVFQGNLALGYRWTLRGATLTPRLNLSYQGTQYSQIYNTPLDHYRARTNLDFKLTYRRQQWQVDGFTTNLTAATYPVAQSDQNAQLFNAPRQYGLRVTRQF